MRCLTLAAIGLLLMSCTPPRYAALTSVYGAAPATEYCDAHRAEMIQKGYDKALSACAKAYADTNRALKLMGFDGVVDDRPRAATPESVAGAGLADGSGYAGADRAGGTIIGPTGTFNVWPDSSGATIIGPRGKTFFIWDD
jgi:hypothetical protein